MNRYLFCIDHEDVNGNLALSRRVPYRFRELPDNRVHIGVEGQSIHDIAQIFYGGTYGERRSRDMFWIICDFQPQPILDCTLTVKAGQHIIVPSPTTIEAYISDPEREPEFDL